MYVPLILVLVAVFVLSPMAYALLFTNWGGPPLKDSKVCMRGLLFTCFVLPCARTDAYSCVYSCAYTPMRVRVCASLCAIGCGSSVLTPVLSPHAHVSGESCR